VSAITDLREVIHILAEAMSDHGTPVTIPPDPDAAEHLRTLAKAVGAVCSRPDCYRARKALGVCDAHYKAERRRQERIRDIEWIIDTDHPERIAQRLGYERPESLVRTLQRWGRHDLANRLERAS
jgi:hypothetical protein